MSTSPSSNPTVEQTISHQASFPEQRVQTIADALGVYLTMSFCDSIVRHSGKSLEELAALSGEADPVSDGLPISAKGTQHQGFPTKSNRSSGRKRVTWFTEIPMQGNVLGTVFQ